MDKQVAAVRETVSMLVKAGYEDLAATVVEFLEDELEMLESGSVDAILNEFDLD